MWRLILFLILLTASVWAGAFIVRHPGYLLLVYEPWMVQMPIWFALLGLLAFLGLFYFLIDSIDRFYFLWFRLKNWLRFRREQKLYSKTQQGYSALIEGEWKKAERLLLAGRDQTAEPLINYLGAAKAAQEQLAFERRDNHIQKAYQAVPQAALAIGLTKVDLELEQDHLEQATATLIHLRQSYPRHPGVLKRLEKVYVRLADWTNLKNLLPNLRKAKLLSPEQFQQFEKNIYCEMLRHSTYKNLDDLHTLWRNLPKTVKTNGDVIHEYVKQLLAYSDTKEIEDVIRKRLKHHYQADLVHIYGDLPFDQLNRQLVIVGAWLKMYGNQPEILLALGKLCAKSKLWGKAKDYYERCLAEGPNSAASLQYGKLLEQLDEKEAALRVYRDGLEQKA